METVEGDTGQALFRHSAPFYMQLKLNALPKGTKTKNIHMVAGLAVPQRLHSHLGRY